jgi:hypothetical protein
MIDEGLPGADRQISACGILKTQIFYVKIVGNKGKLFDYLFLCPNAFWTLDVSSPIYEGDIGVPSPSPAPL